VITALACMDISSGAGVWEAVTWLYNTEPARILLSWLGTYYADLCT
jgi:hypothetical protein